MTNSAQNLTFDGLGTYNYSIPQADTYTMRGKLSCPQLSPGAPNPSQVVVTIKLNGTTKYTGQAGVEGFYLNNLPCALGDTLAFVFSSALVDDSALNAVKCTFGVYSGIR